MEKYLYKYIRGSHAHGISTPQSDVDMGGIFVCDNRQLLGLGFDYKDEIADERHDVVYWELGKFGRLLCKSNPTVLESLFVDDEFIVEKDNLFMPFIENRDKFLTKACFQPFGNYAVSQIHKARGLNKKIVQPIVERKDILDFCYTFHNQGSMPLKKWLDEYGLNQKYCGLVNIPNMPSCYGLYYDWWNHFADENISIDDLECMYYNADMMWQLIIKHFNMVNYDFEPVCEWFESLEPLGYKGIMGEDGKSTSLRLSSVGKYETPLCYVNYNQDGYTCHCRKYREYKEWEAKRNPVRYQANLTKNYDAKNMSECFRLVQTCIEIANGETYKVNRKDIDSELLLDIRAHKFEYDDLMEILDKKVAEMNDAIENTKIPDAVDVNFVNDLVIDIRNKL